MRLVLLESTQTGKGVSFGDVEWLDLGSFLLEPLIEDQNGI